MIAFVYDNKMYFYKDTDCCGTTVFNNQHGSGKIYLNLILINILTK